MKFYDCWKNASHTKVYGGKKKGKYIGKNKIVSTKKKGKEWTIKVKSKGGVTYYKGSNCLLECWWKENGEWQYSGSSSLQRILSKSSSQRKAKKKKKKVSLASVKNDYLMLYYELQEEEERSGKNAEMYYSYIKVPGERAPYLMMKRERKLEKNHMWLKHYQHTTTLEFNALEAFHAGNYVICWKEKGMFGLEVWAYILKGGKMKLYKNKEVLDGNSEKIVEQKLQKWVGKNFRSRKKLVFYPVKWKQA